MAKLFDLGQGSSVNDSARLVSSLDADDSQFCSGLHFHGLTSYEQLNSFGAKRQKKLDPGFDSQG